MITRKIVGANWVPEGKLASPPQQGELDIGFQTLPLPGMLYCMQNSRQIRVRILRPSNQLVNLATVYGSTKPSDFSKM